MELNKCILLLLLIMISTSLLSSTEAICVPRNASRDVIQFRHSSGPSTPSIQTPSPPTPSSVEAQLAPPVVSEPVAPQTEAASNESLVTAQKPSLLDLSQAFNNGELKKVCDVTSYPQVCLTTIAPFLHGSTNTDAILKTGIQALEKAFELAMTAAEKLMKEPSTSTWVKNCLDTCIESFDNGLTDLQSATTSMDNRDLGTLKTMLSAAISDVEVCVDAFAEVPGVESPLTGVQQELSELASNNMAISTLLTWKCR